MRPLARALTRGAGQLAQAARGRLGLVRRKGRRLRLERLVASISASTASAAVALAAVAMVAASAVTRAGSAAPSSSAAAARAAASSAAAASVAAPLGRSNVALVVRHRSLGCCGAHACEVARCARTNPAPPAHSDDPFQQEAWLLPAGASCGPLNSASIEEHA